MVSRKFIETIKLFPVRQYKVAQAAGVNPTTLSQIINGSLRVRPGDERVIAVGRIVGLKATECFDFEQPATSGAKGNSR